MTITTLVKSSAYHDSVALLTVARELRSLPGVEEAAAVMATPANKSLLSQAGLLSPEADSAGPNDLVIVVRAGSAADGLRARERAEALLAARRERIDSAGQPRPRTIQSAHRRLPRANLALISVPGAFAAVEARKALRLGLHVMLFSDNVAIEDEIALKRQAVRHRRLLMGPDCGTAYLNGVPLGFANRVPRGRIGAVAASGTGLQQVATLLAACGEGLSHGIGVGGRDMSAEVGGLMTLETLDTLAADPATQLILVIGKPPAPAVRRRVEEKLRETSKPAVLALLGPDVRPGQDGRLTTVATLEDAAYAAVAALAGQTWTSRPFSSGGDDIRCRVEAARRELVPGQSLIRGLYAGGTLAHESVLTIEALVGPVASNMAGPAQGRHQVTDLGADEFTVGRAHPMLDPTARIAAIERTAKEAAVAVLLLDVVLGQGAAADPAGDIAPAIAAARAAAHAQGRGLAVVATVVGTAADPQGLDGQIARLEAAGVWVLPSNAQAARAAACIAGGDPVLTRLMG